jgi:hypothetical protein
MKVQLCHNHEGVLSSETVSMTLVEYRLLAEEMSRAQSLL